MPKVLVNDENLTNIANAIREKNGGTTVYKPSEMAEAISNIKTGGNTLETGFVINQVNSQGYMTDISICGMQYIPTKYCVGYPFTYVKNVTFPKGVTSIGNDCFQGCTNLELTELPETINHIGSNAFENCTNLVLTKLPSKLQVISSSTFEGCTSLALTEIPDTIVRIDTEAFNKCTNLALTEFPKGITSLTQNVFRECVSLKMTEVPENITYFAQSALYGCTGLTELTCLGNITHIDGSSWGTFRNCSNLAKFALPNITSVPTLSGSLAFSGTPIANGTGYIYVPNDLVDSFKSATNWVAYADQIKPISELEAIE